MTFSEQATARQMANTAGFTFVGAECIGDDEGEVYAVQIRDVEAGERLTFLSLAELETYITAAAAAAKEKKMALAE
jgi:hypothetical protein